MEIAFHVNAGGPFVFQPLEGASLNGLEFTVPGIPTLSQWGLLALVTLLLLGGTVIILRKRGAQGPRYCLTPIDGDG